jgi:hypothetical protein
MCLITGTKITLADNSVKNIEDINYNDTLLVWDFDSGVAATAKPTWISVAQPEDRYVIVKFSDNTELVSNEAFGHRVYNTRTNSFTCVADDRETKIGDGVKKANGTVVTLVSKEKIDSAANFYGIMTNTHINCYANDLLTSYEFNNLYPMVNMEYVKSARTTRNLNEFYGLARKSALQVFMTTLRLSESTLDVDDVADRMVREFRRLTLPKTTTTTTTVAP